MSFSFDPTTDVGVLRVLLEDTTQTSSVSAAFSNESLEALLDLNGDDIWFAAADGARALAAKFAKEAISVGLGREDIRIDKKKKAEYFLELAKSFSARSGSDVVEYVDSFNVIVDSVGRDRSEYIGRFN
ncbi:hypothetical protein LCGC14_0725840 [marine sediment metagenome]|uniref:Uncharacterized protein n=1 Tax=marine sediment metagenome TaxID=412755 RepID=A0A0F9TI97_9ZZZZ|nr:hypothetical protein [Candidatus Aminicenantes bacterium]